MTTERSLTPEGVGAKEAIGGLIEKARPLLGKILRQSAPNGFMVELLTPEREIDTEDEFLVATGQEMSDGQREAMEEGELCVNPIVGYLTGIPVGVPDNQGE